MVRERQVKTTEMLSHTREDDYYKTKDRSVGEDVEQREALCNISGDVKWGSLYGKQCGGSSKN